MVVFAMAPVAGAMLSGPIAGGTLLSLAFLDSLGLLFWVANGW